MNIPGYFTRGQAYGHGSTTKDDQQQDHPLGEFIVMTLLSMDQILFAYISVQLLFLGC
jgi:hypothetical protein